METAANWRDAESYRYLIELNPAGLAWEFLRRNPEYQQEAAAFGRTDDRATTALTAHWGLRFPDSAELVRAQCRHLLDTEYRSRRSNSHASDHPRHDDRSAHNRTCVRQDSR